MIPESEKTKNGKRVYTTEVEQIYNSKAPKVGRKKRLFSTLAVLFFLIFYFGHDVLQEIRSIYRNGTSSSSGQVKKETEFPEQLEQHSRIEKEEATSKGDNNSRDFHSTNSPIIFVWGCNQCSQVRYQNDEPDTHNCPVSYSYNGGSGSSHNWINYGRQGSCFYSCEYCGLNIQVDGTPKNADHSCVSHTHAQALTSAHHWIRQ